jgi:hypothetical protein
MVIVSFGSPCISAAVNGICKMWKLDLVATPFEARLRLCIYLRGQFRDEFRAFLVVAVVL